MLQRMTLEATVFVLQGIKETSDAFPPLKSTASAILLLIDTVKNVKRNRKDWLELARVVAERVASIGRNAGDYPPPSLSAALENINKLLGEITAEIVILQGRSNLKKVFSMHSDKEKMATFYGLMKTEIDTLTVSFRLSKKKTDHSSRYHTS